MLCFTIISLLFLFDKPSGIILTRDVSGVVRFDK